ncbi:trypsin-like peptidase domain-containing protein [Streptomyces sp. ISL-98]|uniref:trypsin-like serine peptidase n=1 Tax=Streptomyces sp. ISL-98 TaxID=2819192 RepID=UPI001BE7A763|nr:serine protease [Streptomyces sp. ISL-98]MBT2511435.1 trypsin-like peptidase domain-containing protein [Streptomyces sp. ISL-98]
MAVTGSPRAERLKQAEAAAERYRRTSTERHNVERQLDAGVNFPDSPEAIAVRAARLLDRQAVSAAAAVESIREEQLTAPAAYERILGLSKELQAWSFLPRGARAACTVARISARENGRELPIGTGFLVSPRLLMTNHHVLPDAASAQQCFLEFDAQVTIDNTPGVSTRLELDPGAFFVADERLDVALVLVRPASDNQPPGDVFGWNRLSAQLGKLVIGEPVNVIGHPMGRLKEIAVRDNALQVRLDDFLHYRTDTEPGSSGSPVFNDQWEVVALHHSGVPEKDEQGRTLRKDGKVWQPGDGDDATAWVANEGVRISSILKHLATVPLDPARRALLAEMGPDSGLQEAGAAPQTAPLPSVGAIPATAAPRPARETTVARAGLRPRETAFGGSRHLVFLHGRSQQGKDPEKLRRDWSAGLNHGLTRAGIAPIDPADAWFPYYGDTLVRGVHQQEAVPRPFVEMTAGLVAEACAPAGPARGTYEQLIAEAAANAGMPRESELATERFGGSVVGVLQRQLSWLAAKTDVDEWVIATVLRDVAAYLDDPEVRDAVLDTVLASMPTSGELVLVTHSLGTVVGMDLITRLAPEVDIALLVTAGSPLGLDTVHRRLLLGGPKRPERMSRWVNAWCPTDAVAIGCPLGGSWKGELTDLAVANARDRAHNIEEYLTHPEVAAAIGHIIGAA